MFAFIKTKSSESQKPKEKRNMKLIRWMRKFHKYPSLILAFFIIMFSISGIILNHRDFFSIIDVNRNILPSEYSYQNWNNAALKTLTPIGNDSLLLFGNIGLWLSNKDLNSFEDYSKGFSKGLSHKKTFWVHNSNIGNVYAGTQSGLYVLNRSNGEWSNINLPVKVQRVLKIIENNEDILVLTRSELFIGRDEGIDTKFFQINLPFPENYERKVSLFKTLWLIHSGKIFGLFGKLVVDLLAIALLLLTITGLIYFFVPRLLKKIKGKLKFKRKAKSFNKFSVRWHNSIGIWTAPLLIIVVISGMFLRPPLLIPIANVEIPIIKYTAFDNPNPWWDKLRDIIYDKTEERYILSTSDGFYSADIEFQEKLKRIEVAPPVSVMGINVFEEMEEGVYLVGSFSGIYMWIPKMNFIQDYITKQDNYRSQLKAAPFGNIAVSGYYKDEKHGETIFEYSIGASSLSLNNSFPTMPIEIIEASPMPLWNLALEVHTGRIYNFIFGKFYILFIPLAGLSILFIIISGIVLWFVKK